MKNQMFKHVAIPSLLLVLIFVLIACTNNNTDQVNPNPSPVVNLQPSIEPLPTPQPTIEPKPDDVDSPPISETLIMDDFSNLSEVTLELGFYVQQIKSFDLDHMLLHIRNDDLHSKLVLFNLFTEETEEIWSDTKAVIDRDTLIVLEDKSIMWDVYHIERDQFNIYHLSAGRQLTSFASNGLRSPDGKSAVQYGNESNGIQGITEGKSKWTQWTFGEFDSQPLWFPDSSGFVYLHDTGEQIGDGAGSYYQLAKFDIKTKKSFVYPFEKGFWGRIEWLKPGVSLISHHGFDDIVAMKIVNLVTEQQYELFEAGADDSYIGYGINPMTHELWISEKGKFKTYHSDGTLVREVDWPINLDIYTAPFESEYEHQFVYYYGASAGAIFVPYNFIFSPDGEKIAYFIGNWGESIYDMVTGVKLIVSNRDGLDVEAKTSNYMKVDDIAWRADSSTIYIYFTSETDEGHKTYIGTISFH